MLPLFVAKDKKLFDKQGVDVEITYIRGIAIEALIANEVQFTRASPPTVVGATLRGADLAVIANTINVPVFSLMTRADLRRPEDLRGKKIGVTSLGDSPDLVLSMILDKFGLQRGRDVTVMAIRGGMPDMILAVSKGFVDGAMISAPSNLRGMKLGLRELIDSADLGVPYLNSPLSTRRAFIKTNRDIVLQSAARLLSRRARNPQRPRRRHEDPRQIHPRQRARNPRRVLPHLRPEALAENHQRRFGRGPAIIENAG